MKTILATVVVIIALGTSFQTGISFEGPGEQPTSLLSFGRLTGGDTLVVIYKSWGCYHSHEIMFRFQGDSRLTVTAMDIGFHIMDVDERTGEPIENQPVLLGPITLSADDIEGLDNLLDHYRIPPPVDCAEPYTGFSHFSIDISHMSNGQILAQQEFSDAPCRIYPDKETKILSFRELWARFEKVEAAIDSSEKEELTLPSIE